MESSGECERMDQDIDEIPENFFEDEAEQKLGIETIRDKKHGDKDSTNDLLLSFDDEDDGEEDQSPVVSLEGETKAEEKEEDFFAANAEASEFEEYLKDLAANPEDFKPLIGLLSIDFNNPDKSIPQFFEKFSNFGI